MITTSWVFAVPKPRRFLHLLVGTFAVSACAVDESVPDFAEAEETAVIQSPLVTGVFIDDSAAPVHVQIKACQSDVSAQNPTMDCTVDVDYALVGGGAFAEYTGSGALLTASYPLDSRTWRATSKDHQFADSHKVTAYAVGIRLDGVNAATLRSLVTRTTSTSGSSQTPSVSFSVPAVAISGGARTTTSGAGQLLTRVRRGNDASKSHLVSSSGTVTGYATRLNGTFGAGTMLEGFGLLEVIERSGSAVSVTSGVGTSTANVTSGWSSLGYGGSATTTSGPGRMLFRIGLDGDSRAVIAQSKDHGQVSGGATTVVWSEGRKRPNSHGLCNTGGPLNANMDSCVATICNSMPSCCSSSWSSSCVSRVTSQCGRSCVDHTCSLPTYDPAFWNNNSTTLQWNNCYNYANNRKTDTFAQPGRASGEFCDSWECLGVSEIRRYSLNDGLIETNLAAGCPDNRDLVAMVIAPGFDYHWYRRDSNGMWTHKPGRTPATNLDNSGLTISNPETADRGVYTDFGGYFCSCSSSTQGAGHAVIN